MFIAITAFGNPQDTIDQIKNMYSENNFYSIHWNRRDKKQFKQLNSYFKCYKNIHIFSTIKVYWGHYSIISAMEKHIQIFKHTNEDIFLHLCNKTINTKDINETEFIIRKKLDDGYNFFDYNRKFFEYMPENSILHHNNEKACLEDNELWRRNYDYKINEYSGLINKWNISVKLLRLSFINPLKVIKILRDFIFNKKSNIIENIRRNFYLHTNDNSCINFFLFSKKLNTIPDELIGWEFPMRTQISPFLCIKRKELFKIINSKEYNKFKNFAKKSIWTEDWFFATLNYNLCGSKKMLHEKSLIIHINIYDWENSKTLNWNKISTDILFLRRVKGLDKIEILNEKLEGRKH